MIESLYEVRRVTSRFPTGEIRKTERVQLIWLTQDEAAEYGSPADEYVLCPPSSSVPGPWIRTRKST